jgi:hypothetical protein
MTYSAPRGMLAFDRESAAKRVVTRDVSEQESNYTKLLRGEEFALKLTYLADIFLKLNKLNLYLQGMEAADRFAPYYKI